MKRKLIAWTKPLLCGCMALGWFISCDIPSLILLGEYAYPQENENNK